MILAHNLKLQISFSIILDEDVESQTEGEELEKAREMRRQEVKLQPLPYLQTDTETEVRKYYKFMTNISL